MTPASQQRDPSYQADPMTDTDWLTWRRQGIGASDVPALLGLSNFDSPWSLWARKTGLLPDSEETQRQRIGHLMEPVLAQMFHEHTGLYVAGEQTWCSHRGHQWARATIDGLVMDGASRDHVDDALGVVEFKTDGSFGWSDGVPARVLSQVQWQLFVTDLPRAWVGVMHANWRFAVHEVERDEDDIAFMLERAQAFWERHILAGEPPPVDASDATASAIAAVWPEHRPGEIVEFEGAAWRDLIEHRTILKQVIKDRQEELDEIENRLKAAMQDAEIAVLDGVPVLTYRAQERTGIDVKALRAAHPEIAEQFTTRSTYRVLRPAPKNLRSAA